MADIHLLADATRRLSTSDGSEWMLSRKKVSGLMRLLAIMLRVYRSKQRVGSEFLVNYNIILAALFSRLPLSRTFQLIAAGSQAAENVRPDRRRGGW
jgi:hypothetical protein